MNALLILAAVTFADPGAYQQAVDCKEGRCWGKDSPGSSPVFAASTGERSNLTFAKPDKPSRDEPPALGAVQDDKPGLGSSFKALGGKLMEYAPNIIGAGLLGVAGAMLAGPWGFVAGAIIGWMLPGLFKKALSP